MAVDTQIPGTCTLLTFSLWCSLTETGVMSVPYELFVFVRVHVYTGGVMKLREPTDFRVCPQAYAIGK